MTQLIVDLGDRSYPIFITKGLLGDQGMFDEYLSGKHVLIVTNETIAPLYLKPLKEMFAADIKVSTCILPDGEQYKTLEYLNKIFDSLLENRCNRQVTLMALGGGVIGDMTGFAAASYQRGVSFIQVPTTLLSQVDSSVGGKTGVNHSLGKNMIGAFYQPTCVLVDISTLSTLPDKELSAGLAEVIKYGAICDAEFFRWLEKNMDALRRRDPEALSYAIQKSCEKKAEVVAKDERESGIRATLNFGHTFGHAIEAHMGYGNWLHGEAVSVGMCIAADLSCGLGWLPEGDSMRLKLLCEKAGLPVHSPNNMAFDDYLNYMRSDKKNITDKIRFVLLKSIGEAVLFEGVDERLLKMAILNRAC
ncbi:MAG: 3-dehydroquinate synthase [Piscirickettsiaceae bacterium]|nr:MAG: 3-dehydroquinate synthase [Piscirickettsiaceae bacterium]